MHIQNWVLTALTKTLTNDNIGTSICFLLYSSPSVTIRLLCTVNFSFYNTFNEFSKYVQLILVFLLFKEYDINNSNKKSDDFFDIIKFMFV